MLDYRGKVATHSPNNQFFSWSCCALRRAWTICTTVSVVTGGTTSGLCAGWEGAELCIAFLLLSCNFFLHSFSQCPNFAQYLHLLSLLDHLLSCFVVLNVAAATLTFALISASLSHVANLSRLLLRVLLDQVRSKNGKAFLYSATRPSDQIRTRGPLSSSTLSGSSTIPL